MLAAARRVVGPAVAVAGAAAAMTVVALVDPNEPGNYPPCPFRAVTGLDCPGCGALRALHALAHGDLVRAADHNVVVLLAGGYLVVAWLRWLRRSVTGAPATADVSRAWLLVLRVLPFAVAVWWVGRNLPWLEWLASSAET